MTDPTNKVQTAKIITIAKRVIWGMITLIITLIAIFGSYFIIDEGDRGVVRRFGEAIRVADPGLGFKIPIVDNVVVVPVREVTYIYGKKKDGKVTSDLSAYTKDQQGVNLMVSISFRVNDPTKLYNTYRSIDNMVAQVLGDRISEQVEIVFGKYNIIDSINKRDIISDEISRGIRKKLEDQPIEIKNISLVELQYSDVYDDGVEKSMQEEINRQTAIRAQETAKIKAETVKIEQQGVSDAYLIEARAKADAVRLAGQAEADAIKAKADALEKQGEGLVRLTMAEKWKGYLPTTMIPGAALPMVDINKLSESKPANDVK